MKNFVKLSNTVASQLFNVAPPSRASIILHTIKHAACKQAHTRRRECTALTPLPLPPKRYHLSKHPNPQLSSCPLPPPTSLAPGRARCGSSSFGSRTLPLAAGLGACTRTKGTAQHNTSHKASSISQTRCIGSQSTGNCVCQGAESLVASRTRVHMGSAT
jgi:hypothetical protein